ncbi:MAG: hypothetical protein GX117_10520 [Candidatus Hydrogenedentes bacterium]|nr:hypothetical protein [Candidatus Hydrogenedentota bacterium]
MYRFFIFSLLCFGAPGALFAQMEAGGDLQARINLVFQRFQEQTEPSFSDDFILADVKLDPQYPRRFDEFSGDISGRYVGAVAEMAKDPDEIARLHRLVSALLQHQREDGRFGAASLSFDAAQIGPAQMALLWGNGRLLTGLLEYQRRFPDKEEVLDASLRLGDFLLHVFQDCSTPEVRERVKGKAANGFICFTQLNEGLELLARASGDMKYRDAARQMESFWEERGVQHTHGYLTTLRGHMLIYESTREQALLDAVETRFKDMVDAGAVKVNGGLLEFFDDTYNRDEGCSEADFVRLCLQLYQATGKEDYGARAEKCLYNSLYGSQFETGDFGHRCFDAYGYVPHPGAARAWWCCTMHGLRAFRDVLDHVVTVVPSEPKEVSAPEVRVHLFSEGFWGSDNFKFHMEPLHTSELAYRMVVSATPETPLTVGIRFPSWAHSMACKVVAGEASMQDTKKDIVREQSGEKESAEDGWYYTTQRIWKAGDTMEIRLLCNLRFVARDNSAIRIKDLGEDAIQEAAIFYGPWLLGVNAHTNPMFHGEPYGDNVLLISEREALKPAVFYEAEADPLANGPKLKLPYEHGGFPGTYSVILEGVGEQATHPQTTVSYWHRIKRLVE